MKKYWVVLLLVIFSACKSKKSISESAASEELAAAKVIKEHYASKINFKTLNIKANAKYKDDKISQSVATDIRIESDKLIWINVKVLGIPMAKALITPDKVSYYEKLNGTYFEGSFDVLSNWLGTELDFYKLQNLFLGKAIDDLTKETYWAVIEEGLYRLTPKINQNTQKEYYFEAANFLLKKAVITQASENRKLEIQYPAFGLYDGRYLPNELFIKAVQEDEVRIEIQYKNITFDEKLSTPFSIPEGYEEIKIK